MHLLRNQQIPVEKWGYIIAASPYSSPFQTPGFFDLCNSVPGMSAEAFALEEDGVLLALCICAIYIESGIKSHFSKRAIIYGGPILLKPEIEVFDKLLASITECLKNRVIYIEARNYFDYSLFHQLYTNSRWEWLPYLNIKLSLKGKSLAGVLGSMKYNRRREIKLSIDEGAIYREAKNVSEIKDLYLILKDLYENKVKLPLPVLDFFVALFNVSIGKIFVILHNNRIIGGSFCLYLENKTLYSMYYCGIRNYNKRIFPTHLSILAVLDFALKEKLEYFDFMGAGMKDKEYGVREYKQEFGGELHEYGRYRKINNKFLFKIGEFGLRMQRLMRK